MLHFKSIDFFGGNEALIKTKARDEIKNKFAKENNIKLIRIPYQEEDNIEILMAKEIEDLKVK